MHTSWMSLWLTLPLAGLGFLEAVGDEKLAKSGRQVAARDCRK